MWHHVWDALSINDHLLDVRSQEISVQSAQSFRRNLFFIKTYPFGMIKLIQPISRIYFYNHELHEFHELGEPWRLLGNHLDGAFAKKAKNSCNSCNSWSKNPFNPWLNIFPCDSLYHLSCSSHELARHSRMCHRGELARLCPDNTRESIPVIFPRVSP